MNDDFYRAFEDRFRGSRELVKSRLQIYLPFIAPLAALSPSPNAIDLGCGRGEWLEVLAECGFTAQGIDLDDSMLEAARAKGLDVRTGDAIESLKELPDASQAVVSGFHIAEHLPFELLQVLIKETRRVLMPGGLLILETPNPENLVTGTSSFYLDPTHKKPIPPLLLDFLIEHSGFSRRKIVRLQGSRDLMDVSNLSILNVLAGVSPDYSVVAQKDGPANISDRLLPIFSMEYGVSLEVLANRYQHQSSAKIQDIEAIACHAKMKAEQAEARALQAEAGALQAEAASLEILNELRAVYASTSWRMTAPLRAASAKARKMLQEQVKDRIRLLLKHIALFVNRRALLRKVCLSVLQRTPILKRRLATVLIDRSAPRQTTQRNVPSKLDHLSAQARKIYADIGGSLDLNSRNK